VQVRGEIAQDAQPGLEGDVAEGALPGAAAAVLLADLGVVELGDGVAKRSGDGCDEPLAAGRRLLAWSVGCQREPVNGEERGQHARGRRGHGGGGEPAQLVRSHARVADQQPAGFP
jgi:hypothetical protein